MFKEEEDREETSGRRVWGAPKKDIDAIVEVGARRIATLHRRYTNFELTQIQDRALYQKKLNFWERGYQKWFTAFVVILIASSLFGWVFAARLKALANKMYISDSVTYSTYCCLLSTAAYNLFDVGRVVVFIRELRGLEAEERKLKETDEDEQDEDKEETEKLIEDIRELLKEKGGMSSTQIVKELGLDVKPRTVGNILVKANFKQVNSGGKRKWIVDEQKDNTASEQ